MTIQQQYQQTKVLTGPLNSMPVVAGIEITTDEAGRFNLNVCIKRADSVRRKHPRSGFATSKPRS
jgi:hypothetical protein